MECTFLLGKTPASKRKKPHSEVEILEARLETIESTYSERLSQMESLLSKVMPTPGSKETKKNNGEGSSRSDSKSVNRPLKGPGINTSAAMDMLSNDDGWMDINSPQDLQSRYHQPWDQTVMSPMNMDASATPTLSTTMAGSEMGTPRPPFLKEEPLSSPLFASGFQSARSAKSPTSSIAPSFASVTDPVQEGSDSDEEGDISELAATMDKLRVFDASVYFGKGSMMFTSTDENTFWDEEISFDVHESHNIDIPPEALVLPPIEVIDTLFDIYYQHYYIYLPMIQKANLLQALENRFEPQNIFLLNSVFMAAALTGDCDHTSCFTDPNDPKTLATPFFERARMVLDYCIGIPRLSTVQGLIMLSRYTRISGLGHSYMQQAIMMASDLGLHRKCDRWIPDKQVQETRKRVFWCVYGADSSTSSVTGRRPMIDDTEIDVPMLVPTEGDGEDETTQTLFLAQICRLWRIFRNIKRYIFNAAEVQDMVPGSLPKSYEQQLIQWQLQLPAGLRFSFDMKADDPKAMLNSRAGIVQMLYESALILLHKPYLSSSEHLKRSPYRSQDICIKAATKITDIAKVLAQSYYKAFELTHVGEYALLNAVRIHVMFLKSTDAKVAEAAQANFDYIMRFFREFYSSPRSNCDEQNLNCVLSFFEEFMHTVKGLSQSSVHVCAGAIKSLAIAKRSRIPSTRQGTGSGHGGQAMAYGVVDQRNISRLVKIGRQERAKARSNSLVSPSPLPPRDSATSLHRKRHSHTQHEGQQRLHPGHPFMQQPSSQHPQAQQLQRQGSIASTSTGSSVRFQDTSGQSKDHQSGYYNPGKLQKVSQYIGPFGGPQVVESLKQFQTTTAILNQQPPSLNQQQTTNVLSSTGEIFPSFGGQQAVTMTMQQAQQQQQQQQQAQLQQAQLQQQQQQQQQHTQQMYNQIGQQIGLYDSFNPTFWSDMNAVSGANTCFLTDSQLMSRNMLSDPGSNNGSNPLSPAGTVATTGINTSADSNNQLMDGFLNQSMYNNNTGNNNSNNNTSFNTTSQQSPMDTTTTTTTTAADTSELFMPLKMEPIDMSGPGGTLSGGVGGGGAGGPLELEEELNADQVQALLEQTLAAANNTRHHGPHHGHHHYQHHQLQQQHHHQQQQQQQFRQQLVPNHNLELSGIQDDFHSTNWPGMM
ncbi:hypothetical protein BGZ70_002928 [Mortierella alpina]|uniref:Xylanolytic transcriptional activator regulatory domain-containing protein n=1 Tax=Mortierella alpina TaxID=64518 RepID=A0A9P6JAQ4_MORAP|nr:hypothetical protein BGZ70_002928 [Mortierella alpina]